MTAVLADDAHGVVESEAEPLAGWLGCKEGLKDAVLKLGWNAGAGIPNLHQHHLAFETTGNFELAAMSGFIERVEGVFNERGPHLVEFAAVGADVRQAGLVVALDFDISHARLEHLESRVESRRYVDFKDRRTIHIGVGFDGADEIEDARRGVE